MLVHRTTFYSLLALFFVAVLAACTVESPSVKGFVLPEGDIALGEQVFKKYGCHGCHSIPGVELPAIEPEPQLMLELGGEVYRVRGYGELLTAVINPTHVVSQEFIDKLEVANSNSVSTPMPYYGDAMTITEMINLVAFLQSQYKKLMPDFFESYIPEDMKSSD